MTTVRKIVTSKIEGDNANNNSSSEIRPRGELGVYENTDNGNLELLMFDGVRQNIRSKVLSKGIFYGGNADSGDGEGLDTIKLIPDAVLYRGNDEFEGDYGDHRYLVIDPTGPNHIHIRAGGTIDQSSANLILGGEQNNVSVSDDDKSVTITAENTLGSKTWMFDQAGHITFPDSTVQTTAYPGNNLNVWVQDFETAAGAPADVPEMAASVEYLANGDIVALINHDTIASGRFNSVARFDSLGTKIWSMAFQGATTTDGWGMAVDNVNGFIYVAGVADDTESETAILTKLSQLDGNVVWSKKYNVGDDNTNSVVDVASDGSPIVVGYADNGTDSQIVTSKINASTGAITWSRALNGQGGEQAYGMAVGPTNEVVTVGYMDQLGLIDAAATLYTVPASNPNWTLGASATGGEFTFSVDFTDGVPTFTNIVDLVGGRTVDGTLVTLNGSAFGGVTGVDDMVVKVGSLAANEYDDRMLVVKYDSDGAIQWQRAIQVDAGFNCKGADADIDSEGNIYVCGNYVYEGPQLFDDDNAMIIIKFNSLGVKQWTRKVVGDCDDFANSIVVGPDDCLYLSAITGNNNTSDYSMVIAKYNLDGTVVWQRLLDNTTTWTFSGGVWFGPQGGGSNLAVKSGYVAVGGGYGDPGGTVSHAIVAQFTSDGTVFAAGDYDFKAATFSGLLDESASNIAVVNAAKTDINYASAFTITDFDPDFDLTSDLVGTLYTQGSIGTINSIDNGQYSVGIDNNGVVTMSTSRGTLEFGALPEPGGTTHFHVMKGTGQNSMDLYFGDDFNYVLQRSESYQGSAAYGVEIGANDNDGGAQHVWRFGTDGTTTFPQNTIKNVDDTSIKIGNPLVSGVVVATVDELVPPGGVWRLFIDSNIYPALGTTVHIGGTVTTAWGTPITATITDIQEDTNTDRWIILVAQDITAGFDDGPKTVSFAESYKTWTFGTDGTLTLPKNSSVGEVTPATGAAANVIVIQSASSILNTSFASLPPAPISNYAVPGTDIVVNVTWNTNGEDYHAPAFVVVNGGSGHTGGGESGGGDVLTVPYADMGISGGGNWTWYVADIASDVVLTAGLESWTLKGDGGLTFPDDTVQTTAYPGVTTVAKNGPVAEDVGKGEAATVTISPSNNINLNVGTVLGVVFGTGFTLDITVAANGDISAVVTDSAVNLSVGDYGTVLGGGSLGGTMGVDDTTFTVATLTNVIAATAIDLTKTINKLSEGVYTLADGVEGQIMYLVAQNGVVEANVSVLVANSRNIGVGTLLPFRIYENSGEGYYSNIGGICTLIFTDGAWQQSGGAWD
jgi:hypothetical protein